VARTANLLTRKDAVKIEVNGKIFTFKAVPVRKLQDLSTGRVKAIVKLVLVED